jgi:MFS superfamily sulfate permease-like transporter
VGITHIPQGLGFALLAKVPPIYGLYTSFFPVFMYLIFGTSKHLSIGTVAVVSLLIGNTLTNLESKYVPPEDYSNQTASSGDGSSNYLSLNREHAKVLIVMANAFWVGVIQVFMFFFQLGFVTSYLSEPLVNGFLSGLAVHVLTSQLNLFFGVHLNSYAGVLKIPKTYIDFFSKITQIHLPTLLVSILCIVVLLVVKIQINERFQKKLPGKKMMAGCRLIVFVKVY